MASSDPSSPILILGLGGFLLILVMFMTSPSSVLSKPTPSGQPFEFLKGLQGCHKGETLKGVHQLKQYLMKFGYLHYDDDRNATHHHADDDEFDDLLESAVKTYQVNYHLKVTGSLDAQTVNEMMQPRCGVPDIINGTTRMPSGRKKHQHGHGGPLSLHTVSHFSFFPGNPTPRWPASKTHLTYRFQSGVPVVGVETLRQVMSRAFSRWAAVTHFTFAEARAAGSNAADIVIGFERRAHGDGASFDGPTGILAHAFRPPIGLFHYDADENWSTNPRSGEFDLESLAVHEIGHLLGLGHSAVREAIMFRGIGSGVVKRDLHQDDVQGIRTLYRL